MNENECLLVFDGKTSRDFVLFSALVVELSRKLVPEFAVGQCQPRPVLCFVQAKRFFVFDQPNTFKCSQNQFMGPQTQSVGSTLAEGFASSAEGVFSGAAFFLAGASAAFRERPSKRAERRVMNVFMSVGNQNNAVRVFR